jgi:hypothetical protein
MRAANALLDEAFDLLRQEEEALAREDVDSAGALAERRAKALGQAWQAREGLDKGLLAERLREMHQRQKGLGAAAEALRAVYQERRSNSRKHSRYFDADRKLLADRDKSFYCDTIS